MKCKKWIFASKFEGEPKESNFELIEEELPTLKDGEALLEALYFSVDPYMRAFDLTAFIGKCMVGAQIARVLESKHKDYKQGDLVLGYFGWRSHIVHHGDAAYSSGFMMEKPRLIPDFGGLPPSLGLGVLGVSGITAYFAFLEICKPKPGETVVVNAAGGAVGMNVGQIAKIKGCKVIGFTGSDEKAAWLKNDIGFDFVFNYKKMDVDQALAESAPNGIDCFFDNVGGDMAVSVMKRMNHSGRIAVCGSISSYNSSSDQPKTSSFPTFEFLAKELRMQGFNRFMWMDRYSECIMQNMKWIQEGKLKYKETINNGFENIPKAFIGMLQGKNFGKAIVRA